MLSPRASPRARVVDRVQRLAKPAKVGHAGTLDPLASGVLVVGVGQATRLMEYVQRMPKTYRATFLLGRTSTTEDIEGEITILSAAEPSRNDLEQAAVSLTGTVLQRPPDYSALKVAGKRAYALARAGQTLDLAAREIRVDRLEIVRYEYPELQLDVVCGSGTYVRSLGRDLALRAGTGAVMSALVRLAIGEFTLATALDPACLTNETLAGALLPPELAVRGLIRQCVLNGAELGRVAQGLAVLLPGETDEQLAALDPQGRLVAVLERREEGMYAAFKNFPLL